MKQTFFVFTAILAVARLCAALDTAAVPLNDWLSIWSSENLPINGSNWTYENDFSSHPFAPLFLLGPGHVVHVQDNKLYPYDPLRNQWTKIAPIRKPGRGCGNQIKISSQDTAILRYGWNETSHQLGLGNFAPDYRSIDYTQGSSTKLWSYFFNKDRWYPHRGPNALELVDYYGNELGREVYDPVHDLFLFTSGKAFSLHYNELVTLTNGAALSAHNTEMDTRRGLLYTLGNGLLRCYDIDSSRWTTVSNSAPASDAWMNHLAYDSRHDKMLYISDGLLASSIRTWAFDCATRQLSEIATLTRPEDVGRLAYNEPLNVFMLIGGKCVSGMCQTGTGGNALLSGIWVFRLDSSAGLALDLAPAPSAAVDLSGGSVKLSWTGVQGASGYHIYRCLANPYPKNFTKLAPSPVAATFYTDASASPGTWYAYKITALREGTEGRPSRLLYTRPGRVLGIVASVEETTRVRVSWERNPEPDIIGYNIYRASGPAIFNPSGLGTGYTKLNPAPVASSEFMDTVDLSDRVARGYVITAVNAFGNESGLSAAATTFPNPPDWVYAIPQMVSGTLKTRLGWQPPERQKIIGVNVYRGPSGAAARQNTGPSPATDTLLYFPVPAASGTTSYELSMAAFFVRAVNVLGQEGFNSDQVSPTATDFGFGRLTPYETFHYSDYMGIEEEGGPGIRGVSGPEAFCAWPNPFNASVNLHLNPLILAGGLPSKAELVIMDCRGRVLKRWSGQALEENGLEWDAHDFPSGLYVARLKAGSLRFQQTMALVK